MNEKYRKIYLLLYVFVMLVAIIVIGKSIYDVKQSGIDAAGRPIATLVIAILALIFGLVKLVRRRG